MTSDLQLTENQFGDAISIEILDTEGNPDNLTLYNDVKLVISTIDFSTNIYTLGISDPEIDTSQFLEGIINWIPSAAKPVPVHGDYWLQIIREATTHNKPVRKFYMQVTRNATQ